MSAETRDDGVPGSHPYNRVLRTDDWVISAKEDWRSQATEWCALERRALPSPFHSYTWAASWYEIAEASKAASPLVVTGRYKDDRSLTVLLALCRSRRFGLTMVSPADKGASDYFKPLMDERSAKTLPPMALAGFFKALPDVLPRHDLVMLNRLDSEDLPILPSDWPHNTIRLAPVGTWSMDLDQVTRESLKSRLSSRLRKTLGSKIRAMEKNLPRRVEHHWPLKDTDVLQSVLDMQAKRFETTGHRNRVAEGPWRDLYASIVKSNSAETHLAASLLFSGTTLTAGMIGIVTGSNYIGLVQTFRHGPAERYSPGTQIVFETLGKALDEGIASFELSIGDQPYKRSFGCQRRPLHTVVLPKTLLGKAAWCGWLARHAVRGLTGGLKRSGTHRGSA